MKSNVGRNQHFFLVLVSVVFISLLVDSRTRRVESASNIPLESESTELIWTHLSTANTPPDLEPPSASTQQTTSLVLDIDKNGLNDLVVAIRKDPGPALVWYKRVANGWQRYEIDNLGKNPTNTGLDIEAGGTYHDIDGDGDLDIVMGGDYRSKQIWWWQNPYPNYDPTTLWTRRLIKDSGSNKHHDQMFGDFDDNGKKELIFWNQSNKTLNYARIPRDPAPEPPDPPAEPWEITTIYTHTTNPAPEGLAQGDIDLDGLVDIVGGGMWFKYNGDNTFTPNVIDSSQAFSRAAVGQLKKGGRPEVIFGAGDAVGPLNWYEWNGSEWDLHSDLLPHDVDHGHSLQIEDVNKDGNLDIFVAEMRIDGGNADAKMWVFLGDGNGNFSTIEVATGYGNHESRLADLDGDGDLDIFGKPYNWDTPRLDIWLNEIVCHPELDQWERHYIDEARPELAIFVLPADLNSDGLQDIVSGGWWYENPGTPDGEWVRQDVGTDFNNVAAVYDFDDDGFVDLLGTKGVGDTDNADFVWAKNDGLGNFTIYDNVGSADGDFLQGVVVDEFVPGNVEVALSWHQDNRGIQFFDVPGNPIRGDWPPYSQVSTTSQDEQLSSGDIDRDGDRDLLLGTKWLRNDATASAGNDWAVKARQHRVLVTVGMDGIDRIDKPAEVSVNFTSLLASLGITEPFDPNSLQVLEVNAGNDVLDDAAAFQFDPDSAYDAATNAAGSLIIMQMGQSGAGTQRYYHLYFDTLLGQAATPVFVTPQVLLTDDVQDAGQSSYKIETNNATYYYHKVGGGFSSLVDQNGNDWISHSTDPESAGTYRGIPNLVYPEDYFHPGRSNVTSSIVSQGPLKATIQSTSSDSEWETVWEVYPDYAQMTVQKADPSKDYWFLYEGTPGGVLEPAVDYLVRSDGTTDLASANWTVDIAAPEWIYFADPGVIRSLYFVHHEDDTHLDRYYAMNGEMTVFGFGRGSGTNSYLTEVPSHFTLGLTDNLDAANVEPVLNSAYKPLAITVGTAEEQPAEDPSGPWSVQTLSNVSGDPDRNRLIDINKDTRLDAVVGYEAISEKGKLAWYEQPATATELWTEHIIDTEVYGPMSLDVADMDDDTDVDVVVGEHYGTNEPEARVLIYENPGDGTGAWTPHVVSVGDEHHDGTQVVDIDNDGDLDIISIGWTHNRVMLYENRSCVILGQPPQRELVANFTADTTTVAPGGTVQFSDLTSGTPKSWSWNFGDGGTSDVQHPSHTYNTLGNYTVTLTASNDTDSDNEIKVDYITVKEPSPTQTFYSIHDSYVYEQQINNNYGTWDHLRVKDADNDYYGFLKFDVQGVMGTIQQAILRLYVVDASPDGGTAYAVNDTSWTETGIKWSNMPALGQQLGSAGAASVGQWVEFDVTEAVTADGLVSFAIKSSVADVVKYSSKEGANTPELVVEIEVAAPETRHLDITIAGQGSVIKSPDLVDFPLNSTVILTAEPAAGQVFSGWSGAYNGTDNPLNLLMDDNKSITATFVPETTQQCLDLDAGWNTVSSNLTPNDPALETVLSPISNELRLMKDDEGNVYWPDNNVLGITEWQPLKGYQIYMESGAELCIDGSAIDPASSPISLLEGWSLISYLPDTSMAPVLAFADISEELVLAKNGYGQVYWPYYGSDQIVNMQPGQAYHVYLSTEATFTYPGNGP